VPSARGGRLAWKKFSVSGRDMRCADLVRDITIKTEEEEEAEKEKKYLVN
jgi:hypothetical protein